MRVQVVFPVTKHGYPAISVIPLCLTAAGTMNTTFVNPDNPHNIHSVACEDCHQGKVPSRHENQVGLFKRIVTMRSENQNLFKLNPFDYRESVFHFFQFYAIKPQKPSLEFLGEILTHFAKLPYENISKIVKLQKNYMTTNQIRLPNEVINDHMAFHLGGTCFSLTFTLLTILSLSDFLCYPFIAQMKNRPNAHCALIVVFEGIKYLVDPGYLLNLPMEIHQDVRRFYRTEHTGVELIFDRQNEFFNLFTFDQTNKKWRYMFQDRPLSLEEFFNFWWESFTWPGMRTICLSQINSEGMVYVHQNFVQVQNLFGVQKGQVEDIFRLVKQTFQISPEWVERAQAAIPEIILLGQERGFYRRIPDETV